MSSTKLVSGVTASVLGFTLLIVFVIAPGSDDEQEMCPPTDGGTVPVAALAPVGSQVKPTSPDQTTFTSGFGLRGGSMHRGIDLAGAPGVPIYAYADGVVAASGAALGFGNWIVIDHNIGGTPMSTVYGHMFEKDLLVKTGDAVRAGQHIANIGYGGTVDPPGPAGAHLHFELWTGGRLTGGTAVDPRPAYDTALAPGPTTPSTPTPTPTTAPPANVELAALPASVGSEKHWQVDTIRVARAVHAHFPQIQTIGGWRPTHPFPDHPSGRAADITIPDYSSGEGIALGNAIVDYLLSNAAAFNIEYMIWRQEYLAVRGERHMMEERGGDTANHYDHVHVTVAGHGFPAGTERFTAPTDGSGTYTPGQTVACILPPGTPVGDDLAPGSVPPEFAPWLTQAGRICPQIRSSLLAAQLKQESGFTPRAVSGSGAQGPAQFMPGTWPRYGRDDDSNGTISPFDIGDAVMAQGRYMCQIASEVDGWIADGRVQAPNGAAELYLAAYNAGSGAVLSNGGFPTNATDYVVQTRPYADTILASEPQFAAINR